MDILEQVFNKKKANKFMVDELCSGVTFEEINRNNLDDFFDALDQMKQFNTNMSPDSKSNYDANRYHVNENQKGGKQL
jgi:hypothetical protein